MWRGRGYTKLCFTFTYLISGKYSVAKEVKICKQSKINRNFKIGLITGRNKGKSCQWVYTVIEIKDTEGEERLTSSVNDEETMILYGSRLPNTDKFFPLEKGTKIKFTKNSKKKEDQLSVDGQVEVMYRKYCLKTILGMQKLKKTWH